MLSGLCISTLYLPAFIGMELLEAICWVCISEYLEAGVKEHHSSSGLVLLPTSLDGRNPSYILVCVLIERRDINRYI